jgi:hypothetical protein
VVEREAGLAAFFFLKIKRSLKCAAEKSWGVFQRSLERYVGRCDLVKREQIVGGWRTDLASEKMHSFTRGQRAGDDRARPFAAKRGSVEAAFARYYQIRSGEACIQI